jgi:hypothetical protein
VIQAFNIFPLQYSPPCISQCDDYSETQKQYLNEPTTEKKKKQKDSFCQSDTNENIEERKNKDEDSHRK